MPVALRKLIGLFILLTTVGVVSCQSMVVAVLPGPDTDVTSPRVIDG